MGSATGAVMGSVRAVVRRLSRLRPSFSDFSEIYTAYLNAFTRAITGDGDQTDLAAQTSGFD
jgi:hypothetical protein